MAKLGVVLLGIGLIAGGTYCHSAEPDAKIRSLLKSAGPKCLAATEPGQLDALAAELALKEKESREGGRAQANPELTSGLYFVRQWRDYLQARSRGRNVRAKEILDDLLENRTWLALVPRSEVLEKRREQKSYFYVRYDTKTIEDFRTVIEKLERLEKEAENPGMMEHSTAPLRKLLALWDTRSSQTWEQMERACRVDSSDSTEVLILKNLILAHVISGYLNLGAAYQRTPGAEESAAEFLTVQIEAARKKQDLVSLWRMENYFSQLTRDTSARRRYEIEGIGYCLEGRRFEAEGKAADAARQYRLALHRLSSDEVRACAADRLREIGKANPEALQEGVPYLDFSGNPYVIDMSGKPIPTFILEQQRRENSSYGRGAQEPWRRY